MAPTTAGRLLLARCWVGQKSQSLIRSVLHAPPPPVSPPSHHPATTAADGLTAPVEIKGAPPWPQQAVSSVHDYTRYFELLARPALGGRRSAWRRRIGTKQFKAERRTPQTSHSNQVSTTTRQTPTTLGPQEGAGYQDYSRWSTAALQAGGERQAVNRAAILILVRG